MMKYVLRDGKGILAEGILAKGIFILYIIFKHYGVGVSTPGSASSD